MLVARIIQVLAVTQIFKALREYTPSLGLKLMTAYCLVTGWMNRHS